MSENVWDYPRPPRLERVSRHLVIVLGGVTIVDTHRPARVLETSHPPVYYVPPEDIAKDALVRLERTSFCEWKGTAVYFDVLGGDRIVRSAAWSYPSPTEAFAELRDHIAFYAGPMDLCTIDGERVLPQPGGFYGGWITKDLVGPFKGEPGSSGW